MSEAVRNLSEKLTTVERMESYEKLRLFDRDVEDDPEAYELLPNQIDYLQKKLKTKILTRLTLRAGGKFFKNMQKNGTLIIKDIVGRENLVDVKQGAIVTCNHINITDNYIILQALMPSLKRGRYKKVIKEGNYTNPPKSFEMFMKYGDTMPLSSNVQTMKEFLKAVKIFLSKGEKILVYPEQSMWNNYKKPRPFKLGAFRFAVMNNVPVQPLFITMEDSGKLDKDGFPIQEYTIHILPAIYPNKNLSQKEDIERIKEINYNAVVDVYEKTYNKKLEYLE